MKRGAVILALAVLMVAVVGQVAVAKKEYKGQVSHSFVNGTGQDVVGLQIQLSTSAMVVTGDDGRAGPFGNIKGNDSASILLTNPSDPVANGDKVDLQFRSYSNKLSVAKWWWVDAKGKRVGQKQKG